MGNALGDPVERELIVYRPPSYESSSRRYPIVVVLPGYAATHDSLLNFKPWEPNLFERYERLLAGGGNGDGELRCGEALLVLPDCFTRLGGSQFVDSVATGRYQTYLADDVLALVDARYRTIPRREARAIVGKSSGGFGALRMGMDRPECFAVIGSHAGDAAFELSIRPRFVEVAPIYERHGGASGFLRHVEERGGPRSQGEFHAIEMLALAHAYAPRAPANERDLAAELPFDARTCLIDDARWARWLAHDPVVRARSPEGHGLRDARLVFLDAGKSDEYGLQFGARILAERLSSSGVAVEHEEFEGGHMGTAYRYDVSLPRLIAALEHEPATTSPSHPSPAADPRGAPIPSRATQARATGESP